MSGNLPARRKKYPVLAGGPALISIPGFTIPKRQIRVDDIRVRGLGKSGAQSSMKVSIATGPPPVETVVSCYFESGYLSTNVYLLEKLEAKHTLQGPAIIIDKNSTIIVEPSCEASITEEGDVLITVLMC